MFGDRISRRRQSTELGHQLPAERARSSLGWDHAAAAKVRHCEGCSEARVQHHSLPAAAIGFPWPEFRRGGKVGTRSRRCEVPGARAVTAQG